MTPQEFKETAFHYGMKVKINNIVHKLMGVDFDLRLIGVSDDEQKNIQMLDWYEIDKCEIVTIEPPFTAQDILDEMDGDMEESGVAQGEIESCLNHWRNKYIIVKRK